MSKQYKIVNGSSSEDLENKVNVLIDFGWVPEGGAVVLYNDPISFTQTMVRTAKDIQTEGSSDNGKQLLHG